MAEPPWGIEPQTYALRDSPVFECWCWLTLADAVDALRARWSALGVAGQCGLNGGTSGARMTSLEVSAGPSANVRHRAEAGSGVTAANPQRPVLVARLWPGGLGLFDFRLLRPSGHDTPIGAGLGAQERAGDAPH